MSRRILGWAWSPFSLALINDVQRVSSLQKCLSNPVSWRQIAESWLMRAQEVGSWERGGIQEHQCDFWYPKSGRDGVCGRRCFGVWFLEVHPRVRREACSWRSHTTASFPWALILTIYIHAYGASLLPRHLLTNCPCLGRVSRYVPFEDFIPEEQAFTALPFPYRMNFTLGKKNGFKSCWSCLTYFPFLIFPSFVHLFHQAGLVQQANETRRKFSRIFSLLLFLFLGHGSEEEGLWFWSQKGNVSAVPGRFPLSGVPTEPGQHILLSLPEQTLSLLLPATWQRTPLKSHWQLLARDFGTIYFLKINSPLLEGLFCPTSPSKMLNSKGPQMPKST